MITLLSVENKVGVNVGVNVGMSLTAEQKRKFDLTYDKGSFAIGVIRISSVIFLILTILYVLAFLITLFAFFSCPADHPWPVRDENGMVVGQRPARPILFSIMLTVLVGAMFAYTFFVVSTRDTVLDKSIMDHFLKAFLWCVIGLPCCSLLMFILSLLISAGFGFIVSGLAAGFVSIVSLYHGIYTFILVIQKILFYFFATEEEKNQWKEEFIKENKLQPTIENTVPPTGSSVSPTGNSAQ